MIDNQEIGRALPSGRSDELQPFGSAKTLRKYRAVGATKGDNAITKKKAEIERDKKLLAFQLGSN